MKKPTVILKNSSELARIYAQPGTQSREAAIRSILVQNEKLPALQPKAANSANSSNNH